MRSRCFIDTKVRSMFQLKISAALVAVLLLVTSAVYVYLTGHIEQDILINEYDEITFSSRAILNNKRLAETSLRLQAESLAREEQFNAQFHTFRQKVIQSAYPNEQALLQNLSASPERQAFWDYLTQWRSRRAAPAAGYQEKNRNILSTHQTRSNPEEWFANQPDLLLVFLVLKEGVPPCLVSYVDQKQNKVVGCNYPNLNQSLNDVARTKVSAFDVNDWNSKDYAIVITPILTGDKQVAGMIVVGYQVSNELVTKLSAPLSDQQIVMVYHKGTIYTDQAEAKSALTSSQMQLLLASNRDIEPEGDDNVSFKTAKSNQVYSLEFGDEPQLFTRVPWFGPKSAPTATPPSSSSAPSPKPICLLAAPKTPSRSWASSRSSARSSSACCSCNASQNPLRRSKRASAKSCKATKTTPSKSRADNPFTKTSARASTK